MSQANQHTLANLTSIVFGLCSLIAAGFVFAVNI
jgi:hypothetical protein